MVYGFQEMKEKKKNEYYYMKNSLKPFQNTQTKKKRERSPSKTQTKGGTRKTCNFNIQTI